MELLLTGRGVCVCAAGNAEKLAGKISGNERLVERGQARKVYTKSIRAVCMSVADIEPVQNGTLNVNPGQF